MIRLLFLALIIISTSGCRVFNPSIMFKTGPGYAFQEIKDSVGEYKIAPNDVIDFKLFTNDGFKLVDITSSAVSTGTGQSHYLVEQDGQVKFPILGRIPFAGMTIRQAEAKMEQLYSTYYNNPFVQVKVTNKRVLIFPGTGGAGGVVVLENENTTLIEALALAGGIAGTGKAYRVRLIRGPASAPLVQLIDLSTMEGLQHAQMVVQANDIIYIEPLQNISRGILGEMLPIIGVITNTLLLYNLLVK